MMESMVEQISVSAAKASNEKKEPHAIVFIRKLCLLFDGMAREENAETQKSFFTIKQSLNSCHCF